MVQTMAMSPTSITSPSGESSSRSRMVKKEHPLHADGHSLDLPRPASSDPEATFQTSHVQAHDDDDEPTRTFTLYLLRHGEAAHNVQEKMAQMITLSEAVEEGLDPESDEVKRRCEESRKKILQDPEYFDAPLSERGKEQAKATGQQIREWVEEGLDAPQEVLVSPLQRTLQTAALVFPKHKNVHVREELRERLTGRPADNRSSTRHLQHRKTFEDFSFIHLHLGSFLRHNGIHVSDIRSQSEMDGHGHEDREYTDEELERVLESMLEMPLPNCNTNYELEDNARLSLRTRTLFQMMLSSPHSTIAVVTHKGYLRALERSALGQIDSPEYGNAEARVYRITLDTETRQVESIELLK